MRALLKEKQKQFMSFWFSYGKVTSVGLLMLTFILLFIIVISLSSGKKLRVSFLDIGQGDSILVQTPSGHDMLIDGGPSDSILEKLDQEMDFFDHHIDVVMSTHPDADHITGLIPVLEKYDVDQIVVSPVKGHTGIFEILQKSIDDEHADIHVGKKGDEIIFGDGVVVHILYPQANYHGDAKDTNNASVSVVVTYGDESVLLTGDLPSTHEGELISDVLPHGVTVYKAGHHGSKYSSGDQLLSYIRPEYAVISAGKNNRYGHPSIEAVGRLQTYTKEILSTIDHGTISFLLDGKTVEVKTNR